MNIKNYVADMVPVVCSNAFGDDDDWAREVAQAMADGEVGCDSAECEAWGGCDLDW